MLERKLYAIAFSSEWGRQMRMITGPRQAGKTTLAKMKLSREKDQNLYYLWDLRSVRIRYKEEELFFTADQPPGRRKHWICFDEIHKMPKWKNILKGIFDTLHENYYFIITGSAKMDLSRKTGDSLSGRYFNFQLFPLLLEELSLPKSRSSKVEPVPQVQDFIQGKMDSRGNKQKDLECLLNFSGFPEPFLHQSVSFLRKWNQDYLDTVIREDIGSLTRIIDRDYLYDLYQLLPEMVGNPISISSLASHLEISQPSTKNYLKRLEDFYLTFRIYPYSKNIKRSLLKAAKCYLFNWSVIQSPGKRLENFVAVSLLAKIDYWNASSGENFGLFYLRNKQKQETDFLVTRENEPWLLVETKSSDQPIEKHHLLSQKILNHIPLVQLCLQENVCRLQGKNVYRMSVSRFFS
jgi:predicted AAA+ superfamily ATPase